MARLVFCVLLCIASSVLGGHEKYEGHQLYRVSGSGEEFKYLDAYLDVLSLNPASRTDSRNLEALVRISPEDKQKWLQYFDEKSIVYTKIADNLADILREEQAQNDRARFAAKRSGKTMTWDSYYRHDEVNDYLDNLAAEYPDLVTVINAGLSYEGRQIKYVRISTSRFENLRKPVIFIDAMVHANEWVTTPVALYVIHQLVVEVVDRRLIEDIDWVIVPLANPDGYEYSWEEDRLWRKTRSRSHVGAEECPGVDGNRNFDHHWGTSDESADPCSNNYHGPAVFSEPEIRVIRNAVLSNSERTPLYFAIHSWGSMILYAWGQNGTLPSNGLVLHLVGVRMAEAMDAAAMEGADRYVVGNAAQVLYFTTGTSRDWTRAIGIPLTYTMELPGYDYGFVVPPTYLEQIITELWAGIAEGAYYVLSTW